MMEQAAYELERFAPARAGQSAPRVRVAKRVKAAKSAGRRQMTRALRLLLWGGVLMGLVCAVLYTQVALTELAAGIAETEDALQEERSLNAWLTFELDNMTSLKNIEERAGELGLEKTEDGQVIYYRVEESNGIRVREDLFAKLLSGLRGWFAALGDYLTP